MQINSVEMAGLNTSISTRGKCLSKGSRALSLLSLICGKEGRRAGLLAGVLLITGSRWFPVHCHPATRSPHPSQRRAGKQRKCDGETISDAKNTPQKSSNWLEGNISELRMTPKFLSLHLLLMSPFHPHTRHSASLL